MSDTELIGDQAEFLERYQGDEEDYARAIYVIMHQQPPYAESDIAKSEQKFYGYFCDAAEVGEEWWRSSYDASSVDLIDDVTAGMGNPRGDFWEALGNKVLTLWQDSGRVILGDDEDFPDLCGIYVFDGWEQ